MDVKVVKNFLFVIIGVIAFIVSMGREMNSTPLASIVQLFSFTILTIGICNLIEGKQKSDNNGK